MKLGYFLVLLVTLQLVHHIECNIISSFIGELKEWTDYFGLTECPDLINNHVVGDNPEQSPESQHFLKKGKEDDNLESRIEGPATEDSSTPTMELSKEKEHFEELSNHQQSTDGLLGTDITDSDKISEKLKDGVVSSQNMKSNTEGVLKNVVKVNSKLKPDSIKSKKMNTVTFTKHAPDIEISEADLEIIIFDDMVKIDFLEENESNEQNPTNFQNIDKNDENNIYSTVINEEKDTQNVMSQKIKEDDFDNSFSSKEKVIPSSEDKNIINPSTIPERKLFVELPIADDNDALNTASSFSKCNNDPNSLSSCSKKDITHSSQGMDSRGTNFVKPITESENDLEKSSTYKENISPNRVERKDDLLQGRDENEDQIYGHTEPSNNDEENYQIIDKNVNSENKDIKLNDAQSKEKLDIFNEKENQEEKLKRKEISKKSYNDVEGEINELESRIEGPATEDSSTPTMELSKEKEHFEELSNHQQSTDGLLGTDITDSDKISEKLKDGVVSSQNMKSNTEGVLKNVVKVNSKLKPDSIKSKKMNTVTFTKHAPDIEISEADLEIIIFDDMVKIDFLEENESNEQNPTNFQNIDKNDENNIYSTVINEEKDTQNVMSQKIKEDDFDNSFSSKEKVIPSSEDKNIINPSTIPERKLFVELPIADDNDALNTASSFSKCNNDPNSLSSCSKKDITHSSQGMDSRGTNFVKPITESENDLEKSSTYKENISPNRVERKDDLLQGRDENEDQIYGHTEPSNNDEENYQIIDKNVNSENKDIKLNDAQSKEKLDIFNEKENQEEKLKRKEISKKSYNDVEGEINELESRIEGPATEDSSTPTMELSKEKEHFEELSNHQQSTDGLLGTDITDSDKISEKLKDGVVSSQNMKSNTEGVLKNVVKVNSKLKPDSIKSKKMNTVTFTKHAPDIEISEADLEIIIFDDMVKIDFLEENESNEQNPTNFQNIDKNDENNIYSTVINEEKDTQNVMSQKIKEDDFDNSFSSKEKVIPSSEDKNIINPSTIPERKLFVELPIADDNDALNTASSFSKCNNDPNSLSSCSKKDITHSSQGMDSRGTNFVKPITESENDLEKSSTYKENISPNRVERKDDLLQGRDENEDQIYGHTEPSNNDEENYQIIDKNVNSENKDIKLNDAQSKEKLDIFNEKENQEEKLKRKEISKKSYNDVEGEINELESRIEGPATEDSSTPTMELSKEKEHFEELSNHQQSTDGLLGTDITDSDKISEKLKDGVVSSQNMKSNTEGVLKNVVKVNSKLKPDSIKSKKMNTVTFTKHAPDIEISEADLEIIIFDDMVKIDFLEENESNEQNPTNFQNIDKNDENNIYSTVINEEKDTQNVMSQKIKEDDFDNSFSSKEKVIPSSEDKNIINPSTIPERKLFVELPIADDNDALNTASSFSKCNNDPNSLSSCSKKDITHSSQGMDSRGTNFVKPITESENDLEKSSTYKENISPNRVERKDDLLQGRDENEDQIYGHTEPSNNDEENYQIIDKNVNSENKDIKLNDAQSKEKLDIFNEKENQEEKLKRKEISKKSYNDVEGEINEVEESDFEAVYRKIDTENYEQYYERVFQRNEDEDDETYDNRIIKLHSLFPSLPVWNNFKYFKYLLTHYVKMYSRKENEDTVEYQNRIFSMRDSESEHAYEERIDWISNVLVGLTIFIDDESNSYLMSSESFDELFDNEEDVDIY